MIKEWQDKEIKMSGTYILYCPNCGTAELTCIDKANKFECKKCKKKFYISSVPHGES